MAVSVILKLEHGKDILDLNSGRYCLDDSDFMPPTTARAVTFGSLVAGAEAVSKRRENRGWSFSVNVTASSKSEAERALRNLQTFLNRAGERTPLYVLYRNFSDYDFEPYFGLHGAFMRYEVVHATAEVMQAYNATLGNSNKIVRVRVNMTIKPQALGLQQQAGQALGGMFEDFIGKADGTPRGTAIPEATTNKMTNPVFMNSTYDTDWTSSNVIDEANKDPEYILFGDTSVKLTPTAANGTFSQSINVGNTNTHVISFYAKRADGAAVTLADIRAHYGSVQTSTYTAVGDGWYRVSASVTGVAAATDTGLIFGATLGSITAVLYVDGFQIEEKAYVTKLAYGDLLGCAWTGTKHRSTTTRTAARLRYDFADILDTLYGWTIRIAWTPDTDTATTRYFLEDSADELQIYLDASDQLVCQTSSAPSSVTSTAVTITAGTPRIFHITYNGDALNIYNAGANIGTGTGKTRASANPTYIYVGTDDDAGNHCGGTLPGVSVFRRAMSATEVAADYAQAIQQVTDGDRLDPLPWVWTNDGDNIVDTDQDGSASFAHAVIGGLMGDDVETYWKLLSNSFLVSNRGVTVGSLPLEQRDFDYDLALSGNANSILFHNQTGSTDSAANADNYGTVNLLTTATIIEAGVNTTLSDRFLRFVDNITGFLVYKDTNAADQTAAIQLGIDTGAEVTYSEYRTITATTGNYVPFVTFEMPLDYDDEILDSNRQVTFKIRGKRPSSSSADNIQVSHAIFLPNYSAVLLGDIGASQDNVYIHGRTAETVNDDTSATTITGTRSLNRPIVIRPDLVNLVFLQHTFEKFDTTESVWPATGTLTITQFAATPRFDIL